MKRRQALEPDDAGSQQNGAHTMAIMVIIGGKQRHTLNIDGWSERDVAAVRLTAEVDGYEVSIGTGRI